MLYGILWKVTPSRAKDFLKLYEEGKVVVPEGLEIINKWIYNLNECIEIVEAGTRKILNEYVHQFHAYATYRICDNLTDAKDVLANFKTTA